MKPSSRRYYPIPPLAISLPHPATHYKSSGEADYLHRVAKMSRHPGIRWAQRSDKLFITVDLPDAQDVKLKLEPGGKFIFSAVCGEKKIPYEADIELYDKIDADENNGNVGLISICYLVKKVEKKWWDRLLKQEGRTPVFLKVDWDKWIDEEDEELEILSRKRVVLDLDLSNLVPGARGNEGLVPEPPAASNEPADEGSTSSKPDAED